MDGKKDLSAIPEFEFAKQQEVMDVDKWLASEKAGRDLCGSMTWCVHCVKGELYPCAKAKFREKIETALDEIVYDLTEQDAPEEKITEEASDAAVDKYSEGVLREDAAEKETEDALREETEEEIALTDVSTPETLNEALEGNVPDGYELVTRYRRSFRSRLIQNTAAQDAYTELKNALLGYGGVKSRMCLNGENFRADGKKIVKFVITGKKLSVFLALDPSEFENSSYRFEDVSDKKSHQETPLRVKITSRRSLKQAKELLAILASKNGLPEVGCIYTDFHFPYKSDEALIRTGLIRPYLSLVKKKQK